KDVALALLGNTLPTGAILVVLISILGPISGAHVNPAVSLVFTLKGELTPRDALGYVAAQVAGGIAGTMVAHAMFALPLIDASLKVRSGGAQWLSEGVAAVVPVAPNPACGTARNTRAILRQSGEEPEVIEYVKTPPSRARLVELINALGISPRELLREKGTPYAELGLADPKWSDDELIDFMLDHPI